MHADVKLETTCMSPSWPADHAFLTTLTTLTTRHRRHMVVWRANLRIYILLDAVWRCVIDKLRGRRPVRHATRSLYFNATRSTRRRAQFSRSIAWFGCVHRRRYETPRRVPFPSLVFADDNNRMSTRQGRWTRQTGPTTVDPASNYFSDAIVVVVVAAVAAIKRPSSWSSHTTWRCRTATCSCTNAR